MAKRNQSRPGRSYSKGEGRSKGPRKDGDKKGFSPKRTNSRSSDDPTARPKRSGPPKSSRGGFANKGPKPERSNSRSRFSSGDDSAPAKRPSRFQEGGEKRFGKRED